VVCGGVVSLKMHKFIFSSDVRSLDNELDFFHLTCSMRFELLLHFEIWSKLAFFFSVVLGFKNVSEFVVSVAMPESETSKARNYHVYFIFFS
jgi:hypothetical protein